MSVQMTAGSSRPALTMLMLVAVAWLGMRNPPAERQTYSSETTDFSMFAAVVERLKAGEHYYPVMGQQLSSRGYPTNRVFNWRVPFYLELLSSGRVEWWRGGLIAMLVLLLAATVACLWPVNNAAGIVGAAGQVGVAFIFAAPSLVFLGDTWAGVLVGLSTAMQILGLGSAAAAVAVLALLFRELAAPFCVVGTLIAAAQRRRREFTVWVACGVVYGALYAWHVHEVWAQPLPEGPAAYSWLQFGGMPFLLSTLRWTGFLFVLPSAGVVAFLVLICAGIANPGAPVLVRAASAAYAAFFLVAGQPFNHYWGLVAAPVWVLASAYGIALVIRDSRTLVATALTRGHD